MGKIDDGDSYISAFLAMCQPTQEQVEEKERKQEYYRAKKKSFDTQAELNQVRIEREKLKLEKERLEVELLKKKLRD